MTPETEIKVTIAKLQAWLVALEEIPHKWSRRLIDDITEHANSQLRPNEPAAGTTSTPAQQ